MSFLKVNYSEGSSTNNNNKEFQTIAEGKYEAVIKEAEIAKSSSGNDMIKITLVIRDDVKQDFGKRKVWDYLVYSDKAKWKLQQVAKAVGIPEGTDIATIQEFAKAIQYKNVKINIKHRTEEYNGETKTREQVSLYEKSESVSKSSTNPFDTI